MKHNPVKKRLREGGWAIGSCVTDFTSPEIVTVLKASGLDFFFLDTEHGAPSYRDIQNIVRSAKGSGVVALVRVTQGEYPLIARALDCGAMGIISPRVESPEEAERIVASMKFPPRGRRGYGLRSIVTDLEFRGAQAEMDSSDEESLCVVQMETQSAVEAIYEITAVPGVDATMVGPFDLSVSLGVPGDFESKKFWDAFDRMVDACHQNGVAPGVHFGGPGMLQRAKEHGARFLVCGTDVSVLLNGWRGIREAFAAEEVPAGEKKGGYM